MSEHAAICPRCGTRQATAATAFGRPSAIDKALKSRREADVPYEPTVEEAKAILSSTEFEDHRTSTPIGYLKSAIRTRTRGVWGVLEQVLLVLAAPLLIVGVVVAFLMTWQHQDRRSGTAPLVGAVAMGAVAARVYFATAFPAVQNAVLVMVTAGILRGLIRAVAADRNLG